MTPPLRTFGRIVARHGVALAAWYLAGEAVHQLLVQLAGVVGGLTTLGGLLILPLAVAARLASYVAMYLTVQRSLPHSAPWRGSGPRQFARATLIAILPFFAFYAAWGMLDADLREFFTIASDIALRDAGYDASQLGDRGGLVAVGVLPVGVLLVALAVRIVLARLRGRLPEWTLALAAYAEVLWSFMLFTLVGQWWAQAKEWIAARSGVVWLEGIGDWFAAHVLPVAAIWEAGVWLVGLVVAAVVVPAAWLTVAGVIYGAPAPTTPALLRRTAAAPRGSVAHAAGTVALRFEALWAAIALIWRGGPIVFGGTVLAYAAWSAAEQFGTRVLLQVLGGHEAAFWAGWLPLVLVAVSAVAEPLRVALIATAYDTVVGRPGANPGADISGDDVESGDAVLAGDLEHEGAVGALGQQEDREDPVGA